MLARVGKFLLLGVALAGRALAANAPNVLADVIYHEHSRGVYDPGDEDTALRANGTAFSYLRLLAARFTTPTEPGGEGSFTYTRTGPVTAELSITDQAGNRVTRTLTFLSDESGTWVPGKISEASGVEQTFSLRPLYPDFPLVNSSSRTSIGPDRRSIFGFVVSRGVRQVLVRVVGPGLQAFGVSPVANAPVLEVFSAGGVQLATDNGWDRNAADRIPLAPIFKLVGAFPLTPGSGDAALLLTLTPGAYTVHASTAGSAGEVLTEIYLLP
jgi:hypothetical protein